MTVFPYGRSGMIAGSMLGLGRALGETVAVLIILRSAAQAGHWSLFDGGYTFASKIASAAAEFSAAPADRRLHRGGLRAVRPHIRSQCGCPSGGRRKGERRMTHTTLDAPVKGPTFHPISTSRKIKNRVAAMLFGASFADRDGAAGLAALHRLGARVPRDHIVDVVDQVAGGRSTGAVHRRSYHAIYGTSSKPLIAAVLAVPLGIMAAVYLVEYGRGSVRARHHIHGRHPGRRAVDRCGAVHLRAVDRDVRVSRRAPSRSPWPWCC